MEAMWNEGFKYAKDKVGRAILDVRGNVRATADRFGAAFRAVRVELADGPNLEERARAALTRLGYDNVRLAIGDGARGWHELVPFQGILVAAAADEVPPELLGQLADGGRLVIPVGNDREQQLLRITRRGERYEREVLGPVIFVPLLQGLA